MKIEKQNPFPGLRPFLEDDKELFFGREDEIRIFSSEILARRLAVIHGKTGTGKTSFFEAGVNPELKNYGFTSYRILVQENPFQSILFSIFGDKTNNYENLHPGNDHKGVFFERIYAKIQSADQKRIILFFDQFEDFFTLTIDDDLKNSFSYELASVVYDALLPIKVVIGIRNDFLFELDRFRDEIPDIYKTTYYLHNLSIENAKKAIIQPSSKYHIQFENDLVHKLLEDLMVENGIAPPPLQIICRKLVETCKNSKITLNDYQKKLGGKATILSSYVENILEDRKLQHHQKTIITILTEMHFQGLTKYPRPLKYLEEKIKAKNRNIDKILSYLEKKNIVTKYSRENTTWFELKHDYLIQPIVQWIDKYRKQKKQNYRVLVLLLIVALVYIFSTPPVNKIFTKNFWEDIYWNFRPLVEKIVGVYNPSLDAKEHINRGDEYLKKRSQEAAIAEYLKAINIDTTNIDAWKKLIKSYKVKNNLVKVEESYKNCLNILVEDSISQSLTDEAYNFFKKQRKETSAIDILILYIRKFNKDIDSLKPEQKNDILKNHFINKAKDLTETRKKIITFALTHLGAAPPFPINQVQVTKSFEFVGALLHKHGLVSKNASFLDLKSFATVKNPRIGDLYFRSIIVGLYLGEFMNQKYYLSMNVSSELVAFERIAEDPDIEYRKLPGR